MKTMKEKGMRIDPRTGFLLLIIANVVVFAQKSTLPGNAFVLLMEIFLIACGCVSMAVKFAALFGAIVLAQLYLFPIAPAWVNLLFGIFANYTRRMLPCFMAGMLLIRTVSMHRIILALRKCHVPQKLIIPASVTIRFFPAIGEELGHIREAMRLREIPFAQRLECCIVPLMMSAVNTAEELSQAAVTRGIENPAKKTSTETIQMRAADYLVLVMAAAVATVSLMWKN